MNNHIFRAGIAGALLFSFPLGALASPIVWVLSFQNNLTIPGVISTVDVNNSYAVSNIILNVDGPQSVAFSSDQTKAYIAYRDSSKVEAVDTATYAILSSISVANDGHIAALSDGSKGYVLNNGSNAVAVLDFASSTIKSTISLSSNAAFALALSPDETKLYVRGFDAIHVINTASDTVSQVINDIPATSDAMAVSSDGEKIYVPQGSSSNLLVVSATTSSIIKTLAVGNIPEGIAIIPNGSKAYVSNLRDGTVSVINTVSDTVAATISLGANITPLMVAVSPDGNNVFVAEEDQLTGVSKVGVISVASDTLVTTISVVNASGPFALGVVDRGFTQIGSNVEIKPTSSTTLTFSSTTSSGNTVVTSTTTAPVLPDGFKLSDDSLFFDISTTASWTGTSTVCFRYTSDADEANLKFMHQEGALPVWVDRTVSLDTVNNIICAEVTSFSPFLIAIQEYLPVTIDIKPGSAENSINLGSNGTVPVAIFSTPTFSASEINPTTIMLASAPVGMKGKGTLMTETTDINGDGLLDFVVHVETEALQLSEIDTVAILDGVLFSGEKIKGTDMVRIVP